MLSFVRQSGKRGSNPRVLKHPVGAISTFPLNPPLKKGDFGGRGLQTTLE